jgi:DNA-binding IclR family transcriptional regulator
MDASDPGDDDGSDGSGRRKPRVQSAERTVSILLAVSRSGNGLKAKEISEQLALPRQVTYHLIHTLLATGVLRKNEKNRYVLGLTAGVIADGFQRQLVPAEHLAPRVRAIVAATGETAYASGWVDGRIVALTAARGLSPVQAVEVQQGYSGHAHARATGKLLLALAPEGVREAFLAKNPLLPVTSNTITSRERLDEEFAAIVARGYAIDNEEFSEGLCCLAVPVENLGDRFALCISVPSERFRANFDKNLAALQKAARTGDLES